MAKPNKNKNDKVEWSSKNKKPKREKNIHILRFGEIKLRAAAHNHISQLILCIGRVHLNMRASYSTFHQINPDFLSYNGTFDIYKVWRVQCPQYLLCVACCPLFLPFDYHCLVFLYSRPLSVSLSVPRCVSLRLFRWFDNATLMQCRWMLWITSQLKWARFYNIEEDEEKNPSKNGQRWKYL